jgi:hypothetical protein
LGSQISSYFVTLTNTSDVKNQHCYWVESAKQLHALGNENVGQSPCGLNMDVCKKVQLTSIRLMYVK